jgi:hypothetical protein
MTDRTALLRAGAQGWHAFDAEPGIATDEHSIIHLKRIVTRWAAPSETGSSGRGLALRRSRAQMTGSTASHWLSGATSTACSAVDDGNSARF